MRRSNEWSVHGPYEHRQRWRIHYVRRGPDGSRETKYETFATRAAAELVAKGARDEAQGTTVEMAVDAFLKWKSESKGAVENTIDNYRFRLWRLLGLPRNSGRPIRWCARRGAELYQSSIRGASDTHINGLSVGRMWGRFCVKEKWLKVDPFAEVEAKGKRRKGSTKERLTVNESRKLETYCFAHADDQDCVLTYGYLMLGKRASELVGVTARDLDDDGWRLRITKAKTETSVGSIPLNADLRGMLLGLANGRVPTAHLFTQRGGREPMSRFSARDRVKAVLKKAGVPELPPQALRRTFTDNALMQGQALHRIADMAGHTSVAVTQRSYAAPGQVEAANVTRALKVMQGGKR